MFGLKVLCPTNGWLPLIALDGPHIHAPVGILPAMHLAMVLL
jgi:hypothetical protein